MRTTIISILAMIALLSSNSFAADELKPGQGSDIVAQTCVACHSLKLVTQNRADREGWLAMIRWMQEKQGLWPLGPNEEVILDYLSTHYGPTKSFRRAPLPKQMMPRSKNKLSDFSGTKKNQCKNQLTSSS